MTSFSFSTIKILDICLPDRVKDSGVLIHVWRPHLRIQVQCRFWCRSMVPYTYGPLQEYHCAYTVCSSSVIQVHTSRLWNKGSSRTIPPSLRDIKYITEISCKFHRLSVFCASSYNFSERNTLQKHVLSLVT